MGTSLRRTTAIFGTLLTLFTISSVAALDAFAEHPTARTLAQTDVGCGGRDGCGDDDGPADGSGDDDDDDDDDSLLVGLNETDRLQLSERRHHLMRLGVDVSIGSHPATNAYSDPAHWMC